MNMYLNNVAAASVVLVLLTDNVISQLAIKQHTEPPDGV